MCEEISKCDICDGIYPKIDLEKHMKRAHIKNFSDRHPCENCDKTFTTSQSLRNHKLRQHENIKMFHCEACGISFKCRISYKRHMVYKHNTNNFQVEMKKLFKCEKCDKSFEFKTNLKRHENTVHGKTKPVICDICNKPMFDKKQFNSHQNSKEHLESSNAKNQHNFSCVFCKVTFHNQEELRKHLHDIGCKSMEERLQIGSE